MVPIFILIEKEDCEGEVVNILLTCFSLFEQEISQIFKF